MLSFIIILATSMLLTGLINRVRAICSGRKGYRIFQSQRNVALLLRKGSVYSTTSTYITRLAPLVYLATAVAAMLFIPFGRHPALLGFEGDIVAFAYILALGRLAMILGAFDSGSSFQGMGASRETMYGMLSEPALLLLGGTLALITGYSSFSGIFAKFDNMSINLLVLSVLVGYAFFRLALAENGRVPVDDPRTHLELTMIHEVMILDLSGVDLAFVQIAGWLKLSIFGMLFANALIPAQIYGWGLGALFVASQLLYVIAIGVIESFTARNRMIKNATYLVSVSAVGLLAFIVAYLLTLNLV